MTDDSPVIELPVVEKVVDKMEKVRAAKKRKSDERDSTLTDMKKQIADMASMINSSAASPAASPATSPAVSAGAPATSPEASSEISSEPVVITKQGEEDEPESPSFRNECIKSGIIGILGLGTWYASNVLFAAKQAKPIIKVPEKINVPEIRPIVKPKSFLEQQPNSFLLPARKRKVGASGLLE